MRRRDANKPRAMMTNDPFARASGGGQQANESRTPELASLPSRPGSSGVRSVELEKLLNSWGALPSRTASGNQSHTLSSSSATKDGDSEYNAEKMVDELLASTWEPVQPRKASLLQTAGGKPTQDKCVSFKQQTRSMNELQNVLQESIERLTKHRQVISDRIALLEKENQQVSSKFQDRLKNPEQLLNQICVQMGDLEERFTKVSSTAVVIGDRLQSLDQERTRVLETDEMVEALVALNDPSTKLTKPSNRLFNTLQDPNQLHEASRVIKKMCIFSTELSSPAISHAVAEIERLSQTIENDLLSEFSEAQEKENEKGMAKCAASLIEYNDKEKVADHYVWNVMKDRLAKNMSFTAVSSLDPIQDLESLFSRIAAICKEQFAVIHNVFPTSTCNSIRELLVERMFNDPAFGIFSYLDQFLATTRQPPTPMSQTAGLDSATSPSDDADLEYVRLLCGAYEKTCALTSAIENMNTSTTPPQVSSSTGTGASKSSIPATPDINDMADEDAFGADRERMRTFLSLQLHSLFGSHRQRYFRTELDLTQRQFTSIFSEVKFPQQLTAKQKAAASKSKNAGASSASSASNALPSTHSSASNASSSSFEKDGFFAAPEISLIYYETLLGIAEDEVVPEKYMLALKETVGRCDFVLRDSDLRGELITKLFSSFVASFGGEYLGMILKRIEFFEEQFETVISPLLSNSPTQSTICYESKRRSVDKLERTIASALQRVFVVVEKHISVIFSTTQEKSDFIGSDTNMSLSCSRACRKCVEYLQPLVTTICNVLLEENRERFLIALSTIFKDLYLQHLQKYRFDPDGACMLLRDVNAYRQIFRSFRHTAIDDAFDILHEVANIFALSPENLAGFICDGKLASLSKQSLLDIVKRRWDYKTNADKIML
ncbi:Exocyst complex component, partial [Globisporangium splendens]